MSRAAIPAERIERSILVLRRHKVLLDADLAALYGVETRVLVQAVKRNLGRFLDDFMFQLDADEREALRSQSVISNTPGRSGRRYAPYALTKHRKAIGNRPTLHSTVTRKAIPHGAFRQPAALIAEPDLACVTRHQVIPFTGGITSGVHR